MTIPFAVFVGALVIAVLPSSVQADILLEGQTPVDRGHGETVGGQIRWIGCDGQHRTIDHPPYRILKHQGDDCADVGPSAMKAPDPDVFGLNCTGSLHSPQKETRDCTVIDKSLADYFFTDAQKGDKVTFRTRDDKITLHWGPSSLVLDEGKWDKFHSLPSSTSPE